MREFSQLVPSATRLCWCEPQILDQLEIPWNKTLTMDQLAQVRLVDPTLAETLKNRCYWVVVGGLMVDPNSTELCHMTWQPGRTYASKKGVANKTLF